MDNQFEILPKGIIVKQWELFIDNLGILMPIEFKNLNFEPKRIFLVFDVPVGSERGGHAHKLTKQYLYCINGKIKVLVNDGKTKSEFTLKQGQGYLINEKIWDSQKFISENTVLLVICNNEYDKEDYITDFEEFKRITNGL